MVARGSLGLAFTATNGGLRSSLLLVKDLYTSKAGGGFTRNMEDI